MELKITARIKKSNIIVTHTINIDESIYKTDNDSLHGVCSDFLDDKYIEEIKWFRFNKLNEETVNEVSKCDHTYFMIGAIGSIGIFECNACKDRFQKHL